MTYYDIVFIGGKETRGSIICRKQYQRNLRGDGQHSYALLRIPVFNLIFTWRAGIKEQLYRTAPAFIVRTAAIAGWLSFFLFHECFVAFLLHVGEFEFVVAEKVTFPFSCGVRNERHVAVFAQ